MYNSELEQRSIRIADLYLDPNNPRFPDRPRTRVPSKRIVEADVQAKTQQRIETFGIKELANSIIRNGFLPLDRIVVTEIDEHPRKYVVVEGNRRLAALNRVKLQIADDEVDADDLDEEYLKAIAESIDEIECLAYTGSDTDIAWILQGIRHLSGIKDWAPAQKAELVVHEIDQKRHKFRAVGEMLGMTAHQVGKYFRAYKALEQMKSDPDYGDRHDKSLFTLFDEAYSKTPIRSWLGWDESGCRFTNTDHLHIFYSLITPDPEHNDRRRIHDPRHMRTFSRLIAPEQAVLLQQVQDYEISIEDAWAKMTIDTGAPDWRDRLAQASDALQGIPLLALETPNELADRLRKLQKTVNTMLTKLGSTTASSGQDE